MEEFLKFYKDESLEEYTDEIRTEIINGIDDILKTDSDFSYVINKEEKLFWNNIRDKFIKFDEYYFNKKVNRLCTLIKISNCLDKLRIAKKSLIGEIDEINFLEILNNE